MPDTAATATDTTTATDSTATDAVATDTTDSTITATDASTGEKVAGEDSLGDAGKKALDEMKAKWKAAETKAKDAATALAAAEAKAAGTEAEHKAQLEEQRIKDEALAGANERILKADIRTVAKGKLNDPNDAFRFPEEIDLSTFEANADGEFDAEVIAQAIDRLIAKKPYLAAQGGSKFTGSADGGARNGDTKASQLSEADVKRLYAEKKYAEIEEARAAGRLDKVLGAS